MGQNNNVIRKKLPLFFVSIVMLAMSLLMAFGGIINVYEESYYSSYEYVSTDVKDDLARGYYNGARYSLEREEQYGQDYEYAWEQILLYHLYDRYRLVSVGLEGAQERGAQPDYIEKLSDMEKTYRADLEKYLDASVSVENEDCITYYRMMISQD